jgi:20S proteasome alpha/beta subunit
MASDSAATYVDDSAPTIGQQQVTKVHDIGGKILFSSSGSIGIAQLMAGALRQKFLDYLVGNKTVEDVMQGMSRLHHDTVQHLFHSAAMQGQAGNRTAAMNVTCMCLIAMPVLGKPCLIQLDETGVPYQVNDDLPFVALGSGQRIADPFLAFMKRILWTDSPPTLAEARLVAAWTISHVVQTNPGGVGGRLQLATLVVRNGDPIIEFSPSDEHQQFIVEAEESLRHHVVNKWKLTTGAEVPRPDN